MRAVRCASLVALAVAASVGFTAAAAAQEWWVKPASGPWAPLPPVTPETLSAKGGIAFFEAGGRNAKCEGLAREEIENPAIGAGVDQVEGFTAECSVSPLGFYLCAPAELMHARGLAFNWASVLELVGAKKVDRFTGMEVEFECLPSTAHGVATEVLATPIQPIVGVDKLKFAGVSSGELESGTHKIWIKGRETLTPASYQKVKAK